HLGEHLRAAAGERLVPAGAGTRAHILIAAVTQQLGRLLLAGRGEHTVHPLPCEHTRLPRPERGREHQVFGILYCFSQDLTSLPVKCRRCLQLSKSTAATRAARSSRVRSSRVSTVQLTSMSPCLSISPPAISRVASERVSSPGIPFAASSSFAA